MSTETPQIINRQQLLSPEFWKTLCPSLHVADPSYLQAHQGSFAVDEKSAQSLRDLVRIEGYFQLPPQPWQLPTEDMVHCIHQIHALNLPTAFCFTFDEFWLYFHRLHHIIEAILGPGYLRLPDFWTWRIDPAKNESGWTPHRDKDYKALFADGSPKSLTLWLPLTDATPLNGCMYLVPANYDPVYGTPEDKKWAHQYSDVRALPAQAGSVLGWNQAVLHWGSRATPRAAGPRISMAFEYQSAKSAPFNQPLTSPAEMPGFAFRLRLIAKQILQYRHMYPLAPEVQLLAESFAMENNPAAALAE